MLNDMTVLCHSGRSEGLEVSRDFLCSKLRNFSPIFSLSWKLASYKTALLMLMNKGLHHKERTALTHLLKVLFKLPQLQILLHFQLMFFPKSIKSSFHIMHLSQQPCKTETKEFLRNNHLWMQVQRELNLISELRIKTFPTNMIYCLAMGAKWQVQVSKDWSLWHCKPK